MRRGKPQPFVIQAISQEENEALAEQCRKDRIIDGIPMKMLDDTAYSKQLMLACVKEPDLKDSELCRYGVVDPLDVLSKMLSIESIRSSRKEVMQINGLKSKQEKAERSKKLLDGNDMDIQIAYYVREPWTFHEIADLPENERLLVYQMALKENK